jgi:hydrogenase maturation protease
MSVCVIGLGQPQGGDDAVGWAVVDRLRAQLGPGVELVRTTDPAVLIDRMQTTARIIVIDALVAPPPGQVRLVDVDALDQPRAVSSHALSVRQAIALGRTLGPCQVTVVAVTIERPRSLATTLSPVVAASVAPAADAVVRLLAPRSHR